MEAIPIRRESMDIGKALTYMTEDPRWKEKLAIGTGVVILSTILSVVLIGVVGYLIVMGYMVRLLQNVRDGHAYPMPEWDQWGDDLVRGLKLVVVIIVWSLPAILFSIPVSLGGALADGRGAGAFIGTTILFGGMCLLILYGLFLAVAQASFTIAYARDEQIGSGLQVREIWDWTLANIGQLIIVALAYIVVSIGVSLVGSIVGTLLCIIGLIVTLPLAQLIVYLFQFHLYGQLAAAYPFDSTPIGSGPTGTGPTGTGPSSTQATGTQPGATTPGATTPGATTPGATTPGATTPGATTPAPENEPQTGSRFEDNPYAAFGPPAESDPAPGSGIAGEGIDATPTTAATEPPASAPESEATYPESGIEESPSEAGGAAASGTAASDSVEDAGKDDDKGKDEGAKPA
jgi:hypothetical protein